jgi:hypothetical protein
MSTGFTPLTDAQLQTMDLSSLQVYSQTVSTTIGFENSTISATQAIQAQYEYMILTSQSTIDGLGYEIMANSNLIISADARSNLLVQSNAMLDSTITNYNSSIIGQLQIMSNADATMSSLVLESAGITSSLAQSDINFNSSAVYYSSLYMTFKAKDQLYQTCLDNIQTTSTLLTNAVIAEKISYDNWQISSAYTVARSAELSTLYLNSNAIQSTLTQYIVNEQLANANLASTNTGIQAVSSLYATALVNQQYYQSLSTQSGILEVYTAAYSTFMTASASAAAAPTNTVLVAASNMSQQRLSSITLSRDQSAAQVAALQPLVAGAITDTFAASLACAEEAVQLEIININTFTNYMNSSIAAVSQFSSMYEQAAIDVASSLSAVSLYSSFYVSSIAGSNALMDLAAADADTIAGQQAQVDAISLTISSLVLQNANYTSSYSGWIAYSTLMTQQVAQAVADLTAYSSFYESTNKAIGDFNDALQQTQSSITGNTSIIQTQSSILESETINLLGYQAQIAASFNIEEESAYQYRETYVRQKRMTAQQYYDACVLQQVQTTSTQNGNLIVQAAGAPVTPISINLNTPTITLAYNNLTTITTFLNNFTSIYANYDIQTVNLQGVSTSVGAQRAAYSTLTTFSNQFMMNPNSVPAGQSFSNAQQNFINKQIQTTNLQSNVDLTQAQINTAKNTFLTTYQAVFLSSDIFANESTISSFLITGFNTAVV